MSIEVCALKCPKCKLVFWSRYGHDFRHCGCKYCFVDGGREYMRYGWGDKDGSTSYGMPKSFKLIVNTEKQFWKGRENYEDEHD